MEHEVKQRNTELEAILIKDYNFILLFQRKGTGNGRRRIYYYGNSEEEFINVINDDNNIIVKIIKVVY